VDRLSNRLGIGALAAGLGGFFLWLTSFGRLQGLAFTGGVLQTLTLALAVGALAAGFRDARAQGRIRPRVVLGLLLATLAVVVPAALALLMLAAIASGASQGG
jgi:hypothetical protein